ncbi:Krab-a domain-containing protein 2-like protein [Elysia marginata]|uniref:Krab-a domain-containing protein 2-like protein n=1 Tax=Elysia marginata TaxID=1093978 RepID=A0AAV4IZ59_9GAST|nr:Krab-a domain-containing protein 2-like protein [Elysia marginata]
MNFSHVDQIDDVGTVENVALLEAKQAQINFHREQSRKFQMEQAERMVKRSRIELAPGQKGDNVAIPIPLVDRGCGDPRNILAVILDRSENDNYTLATKHGILKGAYSRNEFKLCPEKLLLMSDVNCTTFVSLREAVVFGSRCGGQGYIKCSCSGSKKCQTNRCKCFKAKLKCNSRCHQSLNCKNK